MSVDLELAPKTKRPAGERRCEPVVHPDVERAQALRMAEVAKALGDPIQWAYSYVIPDALKELSAWLS